MNKLDKSGVEAFVVDLQRRGYTKYKTTKEVEFQFDLTYERAYYQVRKYWKKTFITQDGNKI